MGASNKIVSADQAQASAGVGTGKVGGQLVYYVGADQHVHSVYRNTVWHPNDVTATAPGAPLVAAGFMDVLGAATELVGGQDLFYVGSDKHIHQLYSNTTWHPFDVTVAAGAVAAN